MPSTLPFAAMGFGSPLQPGAEAALPVGLGNKLAVMVEKKPQRLDCSLLSPHKGLVFIATNYLPLFIQALQTVQKISQGSTDPASERQLLLGQIVATLEPCKATSGRVGHERKQHLTDQEVLFGRLKASLTSQHLGKSAPFCGQSYCWWTCTRSQRAIAALQVVVLALPKGRRGPVTGKLLSHDHRRSPPWCHVFMLRHCARVAGSRPTAVGSILGCSRHIGPGKLCLASGSSRGPVQTWGSTLHRLAQTHPGQKQP